MRHTDKYTESCIQTDRQQKKNPETDARKWLIQKERIKKNKD